VRGVAHALPVTAILLILFSYWFAIADRHRVFLYEHDMGPLYPDTSAFSSVTSSRYWMAGLVGDGAVLLLYCGAAWFLRRVLGEYNPPAGWRVWSLCAPALLVGIPAITMSANAPTLTLGLAMKTALVTLAGLIGALAPGPLAARHPSRLAWLALDGGALAMILCGAVGLEDLGRWLKSGADWRVAMVFAVMIAGLAGLVLLTALRTVLHAPMSGARSLLVAGFCVAYLAFPLLHHVIGTDGYYYITDSDNFFADKATVQFFIWATAAAISLAITRLRQYLSARYSTVPSPPSGADG
jgi:hypothetical protein